MAQRDMSLTAAQASASDARARTDGHGYESADAALAREQAELDVRTPDWDIASRITTARGALKRGVPADVVRKAYGERVFSAASEQEKNRAVAHATG